MSELFRKGDSVILWLLKNEYYITYSNWPPLKSSLPEKPSTPDDDEDLDKD